jgi:hypothetical protein
MRGTASSSAAVGREGDALAMRETDTFRFQVSKALPLHLLVAWFEQAEPGDRIEYCAGYVPLREDAAWKLAGSWAREGLVHLVTERAEDRAGVLTHWIAERRPLGFVGDGPALGGKRTPGEDLKQVQLRALLGLLRDAAAARRVCPSLADLAVAVCGSRRNRPGEMRRGCRRVGYLRDLLVAEGKIAVAAGTPARKPVVTILARGKGCGMSTASEAKGNDNAI